MRTVLVIALASVAASASAQPAPAPTPPPAASQADQLWQQARTLLEQGNAKDACPLFEQSYALDPGRGTLINLAACYDLLGRRVDAYKTFREVERQSVAAGDTARVEAAREAMTKLRPVVSRLHITQAGAEPPGYALEVNGKPLGPADRDDWAVEPGTATVRAFAPGRAEAVQTVTVPATPASDAAIDVSVPELTLLPGAVPGGPPGGGDGAPHRSRNRVILSAALAGAGVVVFGAGVGIGLSARSMHRTAIKDRCVNGKDDPCVLVGETPAEMETSQTLLNEEISDAEDRGTLGTYVGIAGIAMAAAGAVLFFTAPKEAETRPVATVTRDGVSFLVTGRF